MVSPEGLNADHLIDVNIFVNTLHKSVDTLAGPVGRMIMTTYSGSMDANTQCMLIVAECAKHGWDASHIKPVSNAPGSTVPTEWQFDISPAAECTK